MALVSSIELAIRAVIDDRDRERIRALSSALTTFVAAADVLADALKALTEGNEAKTGRIQVGERVRMTASHHRKGQHGRLDVDDGTSVPFLVELDDGSNCWAEAEGVERA
jgi:hypothetical protein